MEAAGKTRQLQFKAGRLERSRIRAAAIDLRSSAQAELREGSFTPDCECLPSSAGRPLHLFLWCGIPATVARGIEVRGLRPKLLGGMMGGSIFVLLVQDDAAFADAAGHAGRGTIGADARPNWKST
jgi:hypothetical protein